MAADEILLEQAARGQAAFRLYGWKEPTVSLGYFQPASSLLENSKLADLPCVRRATGGLTLVHHHELTYALALPADPPWNGKDWRSWQGNLHAVIAETLARFGVETRPVSGPAVSSSKGEHLCFLDATPGDLLIEAHKVVGSAQRRQRGALLQHGAILLATSPFAAELPGLLELTGRKFEAAELADALASSLVDKTGWRLRVSSRTNEERQAIEARVASKYGNLAWTGKR